MEHQFSAMGARESAGGESARVVPLVLPASEYRLSGADEPGPALRLST